MTCATSCVTPCRIRPCIHLAPRNSKLRSCAPLKPIPSISRSCDAAVAHFARGRRRVAVTTNRRPPPAVPLERKSSPACIKPKFFRSANYTPHHVLKPSTIGACAASPGRTLSMRLCDLTARRPHSRPHFVPTGRAQFVAFRSAKERSFAERKTTICQTGPPPTGETHLPTGTQPTTDPAPSTSAHPDPSVRKRVFPLVAIVHNQPDTAIPRPGGAARFPSV